MSDEMAPGEIARSLNRLEKSQADQTETLGEIRRQTTKTNGRVDALEREVRDLKRPHLVHESKRATDTTNSITVNIPINAKTITAIVAAIVALAMAGWKAGLF